MRHIFILCYLAISLSKLGSCVGSRIMTITIPQEADNPYTSPTLMRFMTDSENQGAAIVVRDPNAIQGGAATSSNSSMICSLLERGLAESPQRFNPRDRILFENAVSKLPDGSNYPEIRKLTGTDVIFEVTSFRIDTYPVSTYTDDQGQNHSFLVKMKKSSVPMTYNMYGFSIEVKVILLADNLIAGIYKYYQTPCAQGCTVTYYDDQNLRFQSNSWEGAGQAKESNIAETSYDRFRQQISDFITKTVIPSMFAQMEGKSLPVPEVTKANAQPQMQQNQKKSGQFSSRSKKSITNTDDLFSNNTQQNAQQQNNDARTAETDALPNTNNMNSNDISNSISDQISRLSSNADNVLKKSKEKSVKTDEGRYLSLTDNAKAQVDKFITSNLSKVKNVQPASKDEVVLFCKSRDLTKAENREDADPALIVFLDGQVVGMGSASKGVYSNFSINKYPKGFHTLSITSGNAELLSTPVDFSIKNYFLYDWVSNQKLKLVN